MNIDDDVPMPTAKAKREAVQNARSEGREFWLTHAAYWRERGNETKAAECEREAAAIR